MPGEVDLNCDMGEGAGNDELIMPYITSANIACGYHAGDETTAWQTIESAINNNVTIGIHPSFLDRENFGRKEMDIPAPEVYELITQQLIFFNEIAGSFDKKIHHLKPHGALYNMSAKDPALAKSIAQAAYDFDAGNIILYGLSGSHSIHEGKALGLKTVSEVFADRTYQNDGSLTPRSQQGALIEETDKAIAQVLQMIQTGTVTSISGKQIPIAAETICIHGDGKNAVSFAKTIYEHLKKNNIVIKAV